MGFPIRKSADQRLFAPPHGLSQRTTSFIASQRQGIHRILLRHLIALIIDAHRSAAVIDTCVSNGSIERPVCFKRTRERRGQAALTVTGARLWSRRTDKPRKAVRYARATKVDRIRFLFTMSDNPRALARARNSLWTLLSQVGRDAPGPGVWWSQTGSNRRPHACKARALPTELWPLSQTAGLVEWWAWEDLNLRPHAYQARALTN